MAGIKKRAWCRFHQHVISRGDRCMAGIIFGILSFFPFRQPSQFGKFAPNQGYFLGAGPAFDLSFPFFGAHSVRMSLGIKHLFNAQSGSRFGRIANQTPLKSLRQVGSGTDVELSGGHLKDVKIIGHKNHVGPSTRPTRRPRSGLIRCCLLMIFAGRSP